MIFDARTRSELRPKRRNESSFAYLNLSARPEFQCIRDFLEKWVAEFPSQDRADVIGRLRSNEEAQHLGAVFEIMIFAHFRVQGYSLETHPSLPNNSGSYPDFIVSLKEKPLFYLEATLAMKSKLSYSEEARVNELLETINKIESPNFFLSVTMSGSCKTPPPGSEWRKSIAAWLNSIDPDEITTIIKKSGLQDVPSKSFTHEKLNLNIVPISKSPSIRGKPNVRSICGVLGGIKDVTTDKAIRTAVTSKGKKYGTLDLPLIVAVNAIEDIPDIGDFFDGLFGSEQITYTPLPNGDYSQTPGRSPTGAFFGPIGPQYRNVSAVLCAMNLNSWGALNPKFELVHNPWATHPVLTEFVKWPAWLPDWESGTMQKIVCASETKPGETA